MAGEKLNRLIMKRTSTFNRLKETYDAGVKVKGDASQKVSFLVRADEVEHMYEEFSKSHNSIIMQLPDDEEFQSHDDIRKQADTFYYSIKAMKRDIYAIDAPGSSLNTSNISDVNSIIDSRLPKITIPHFEGNLKLWPSFIDLFKSLIHDNTSLNDVQKFQYLHSSLKGEPLNLIKGLPITENNYLIAYETLLKRYQNKRFAATSHYNEIFNAPHIQKASAKELRFLLDTFLENISALKALEFDVDSWDFLLFNMMLPKLDTTTRTEFEKEFRSEELPTFQNLIDFLESYCKALDSVQLMGPSLNNSSFKSRHSSFQNPSNTRKVASSFMVTPEVTPTKNRCISCAGSHILCRCQSFLAKTPSERYAFVKQHNYCVNCLRSPHSLKKCTSTINCKICKLPHHTLLHFGGNSANNTSSQKASDTTLSIEPKFNVEDRSSNATDIPCVASSSRSAPQPPLVGSSLLMSPQTTILLSTVQAEIKDIRGHFQNVRILLDTGSMASFISESCANKLGLPRKKCVMPIEGLNSMSSSCNRGITQCHIKPCGKSDPTFTFEAFILPKVCSDQPKMIVNPSQWAHIQHVPLADPKFHIPGPIDILIGAELVPYILRSGRLTGCPNQPVALETIFGYILQGRASNISSDNCLTNLHVSREPMLDICLQKFWELENICKPLPMSPEDAKCEDIFKNTTYRQPSGRFVVSLPFKQTEPHLGNSYSQAVRRFNMLEKRLYKNPDLKSAYKEFMQDYLDSGHMSLLESSEYQSHTAYYIPHFCISKGSKIRVVFDASCATSKGISLNDTLLAGPKLQQDISSILLQFRFHPFVFICDIKQMYRQILIHPPHRDFQRILWRFCESDPLQEYILNTVTYGVSSSPYLALRTLQELAKLEGETFPKAAEVLRHNIFVDDAVVGAESVESLLSLQSELIQLLYKGRFELRKWASNHAAILSSISSSHLQMPCTFDKGDPVVIKVLGLQWHPSEDTFSYSCSPIERPCTKRNILSEIARIYDPLGFVAPVVLFAKHLMQQLWASDTDWDDHPCDSILQQWSKFKLELPMLSTLKIPRRTFVNHPTRVELHGFCDASQIGCGAVVFVRAEQNSGDAKIFLISGKARVAPLKTQSLPRLELVAAVLLSDLIAYVKSVYSRYLTFDATFAWSDSQVVLAWLASSAHRWKPFVANRVAHIQDIIPFNSWHYVPSADNPADCASRGLTPSQLISNDLWFHGPSWLHKSSQNWPVQPVLTETLPSEFSIEERKSVLKVDIDGNFLASLLNNFSSLPKIQRIVAYILRFVSNTKSKHKISDPLSALEIQKALFVLVKHVQDTCFSDIFDIINKNSLLPKPFRKLAVFIDENDCLRVGGRLKNSELSYNEKHPLLLPKSHRLTELIIEYVHKQNFHPGFRTLQYLLLQQFWVLSPRSAIHQCLSKCIRCFRSNPKSYNPLMADLPSIRVHQAKLFSRICIDYAGPLSITMSKLRGAKTLKAYICVFVCCAVKAIHLELVSDLTSEAFIAAFRRFVSRRGRCSEILSDQGTNFIGANRQLQEYSKVAAEAVSIKWRFNPPGAPHFNGLAESGVKSVKTHLHRVVGEQVLTYEELNTLLIQIEALLNSRPLCAVSNDPNDLQPLTPAHFMTLEPLNSFIPDPDLSHLKLNHLNRWQLIQRMHADFWRRWQHEYLHTLQQRAKWSEHSSNIKIGSLVLIKDEQKSPLQWALARVLILHPGKDGVVRVVTIKTSNGVMQRPVVKLCPLPGN